MRNRLGLRRRGFPGGTRIDDFLDRLSERLSGYIGNDMTADWRSRSSLPVVHSSLPFRPPCRLRAWPRVTAGSRQQQVPFD
jgi:hypothetical protein